MLNIFRKILQTFENNYCLGYLLTTLTGTLRQVFHVSAKKSIKPRISEVKIPVCGNLENFYGNSR